MTAWRWLIGCVGLSLTMALAQVSPLETAVNLSVHDAPLSQVVAGLGTQSGAKISAEPGVANTRVTVELQGVQLGTALHALAEITGLKVGEVAGGYLFTAAGNAGLKPIEAPNANPLKRGKVKKIRYECKNLLPSVLAGYFGRPGVRGTGTGLEPAAATKPVLNQTCLVRRDGESAAQKAEHEQLLAVVSQRLAERWDAVAKGTDKLEHAGCSGAMPVPAGVAVVIGYDPTKSLIAVGDAVAVEHFRQMAAELDRKASRIELKARYFVLPAASVDKLGLKLWSMPSESGNSTVKVVQGELGAVSAQLAQAAVTEVFDSATVTVDNARPAVFSASRLLGPAPGASQDAPSGLATTDVKVVPWLTASGIVLHVEPAFGDVLLDLDKGAAGRTGKVVGLPCTCVDVVVSPGNSLVVGGAQPRGAWRAPEAGRALAGLPLAGDLYRPAGDAASDKVVVVVLSATPSTK